MTPFEKAVEAGAMAIQQTDYSNVGVSPWDHMPERSKAMFKSESRAALTAALTALESEGWVLVPVEPTEAMLSAMTRHNADWLSDKGPYPRSRRVYSAMLASRPAPTAPASED